MANLLSWAEQQAIKPMSANNSAKYAQLTTEIENNELLKMLGVAMVQDLIANPTTTANAALLAGSSFTNYRGETISHKGLKFVIAYLNFSKYLGESYVADTYTGFVSKNRPDSTILSEGAIRRMQETERAIALTAWDTVKEFLNTNSTDYPYWHAYDEKKVYRPKLVGLRKTVKGGQDYNITRNDEEIKPFKCCN